MELEEKGEGRDKAAVCLLADLQESQDKEAEYLLRDLAVKVRPGNQGKAWHLKQGLDYNTS